MTIIDYLHDAYNVCDYYIIISQQLQGLLIKMHNINCASLEIYIVVIATFFYNAWSVMRYLVQVHKRMVQLDCLCCHKWSGQKHKWSPQTIYAQAYR